MAMKSWILLSVDKVLADSQHREHLRPKYTRDIKPSTGEIKKYMEGAIHDSPVPETLELIRLMIAQGYHILLTCSNKFPFEQWFAVHAPDIPLDKIAQIEWKRGLTYDAQMLIQLRQLRDNGDTVFMSLTASSSYMATVRYLFPRAITSIRTPDSEKAVEQRETGKAAKIAHKHPAPVDLKIHYLAEQVQRKPTKFDNVLLNSRWLNVETNL